MNAIDGSANTNIIAVADNANGSGQISIYDPVTNSWTLQNDTVIPDEDFLDVHVIDSTKAVIVGDDGSVLTLISGSWTNISISTTADFNTVWAYDVDDIFVAANNGIIYHYDGTSWTANLGSGSNGDDFVDSWGNTNFTYFLTDNGDVFRYDRSYNPNYTNAAAWSSITPNCSGNIDFNGFTSNGSGIFYLLGENTSPNPDEGVIFSWNGVNSWSADTCSNIFQTSLTDDINALSINPDGSFTAVGDSGVVVTSSDSGSSWNVQTSSGENINTVYTLQNGSSIIGSNNGSNQICTEDIPHFAIIHDGSASTCQAEAVTIRYHDTSHATTTYSGTVKISSSTGNGTWALSSGNNSASFSDNGDGSANYTFNGSDSGEITLTLSNSTAETVNINVANTGSTVTDFLTEDNNLVFSNGPLSTTYADDFSNGAYNNSSGASTWSGSWTESGDDGTSSGGYLTVTGQSFRLNGNDDDGGNGTSTTLTRTIDLAGIGATGATLQFKYKRTANRNNDRVIVDTSTDGTTWTQLVRYNGNNDANFITSSTFTLPVVASTLTYIRFRNDTGLDAADYVEFDDIVVTATGIPSPCTTIDHIEFIHDAAGITCNPEQVTVKACANTDCSSLSTTSTTVTLAPTGWLGGDSKTFTGSATYSLKHTVAETVALSTTSVSPVPNNTLVCKTSAGTVIDPCNITFSDSGFIFYNETDSNTTILTQLSGKNSNVDYNAKNYTLRAVKKSDNDPAQCVAAFQNKTLDIDFAAECSNPSSCVAGKQLILNGTALVTNGDNAGAGSSSYDTRSVTFDANGKYSLIFNYPEAGQIELHARHNILDASGTASGNYMSGQSSFIVRPLGFSLSGLSYASNSSGTAFTQAGENFITTLTAVAWQAADDTDSNGVPDDTATLTDNTITTNFGNESSAIIPSNVTAIRSTTLTYPGTLSNPANGASFTSGIGTKTLSWDEVGIIDLTTTLSSYLSGADNIIGIAKNVGRFTAHHFDTTLINGCNPASFTYSEQPFSVTAIAKNKAGNTTQNFENGSYAYTTTLSNAGVLPIVNFTNNTIANTSFNAGIGTQTNTIYTFATKETVPENITLRARDTDTSTAIGVIESTTEVRSGRTNVENTYGSELTDMLVTANVEYYTSNGFVTNTTDQCTTIDVILTDVNGAADPVALGTGAGQTCIWDDADNSVGGTDYTCNADATKPQFSEPPVNGSFNINLKAPGANSTGDIDVTLTSPSWLNYDWDADNIHDNDPTGRASFGLYRGDDRIIYQREVFN